MTARYQAEKTNLILGFVPLLDAAPLIVAKELGYFSAQGLTVQLQAERSWASIRDKVAWGLLDGAQMLAPLPLASTLGLGSSAIPMVTGLVLSQGGNAISLSEALCQQLDLPPSLTGLTPAELGARLRQHLQQSNRQLTLATVSPYSCHHYQLHYWLQLSGIEPRQVNVIGLAPADMASQLDGGRIDGFCVGEPWNSLSQQQGSSRILLSSEQLWPHCPEKVFAVTADFASKQPQTHLALITALLQACQWLATPEAASGLTALLAQPAYLPDLLQQMPAGPLLNPAIPQAFFGDELNFPWCSQAAWLQQQMRQLGQWQGPIDPQLLRQIYRTDLYRQAAAALQLTAPASDWRLEGQQAPGFAGGEIFSIRNNASY
ncbi:CmpA/NrtA family ABC transporter substrate-binding protein [Alkalimonas sp. NCh-2]|uniref:CmpA/NrtA family ABC transporter substrate-binding protein n=1 Tax=Alkalimonas sp. NCh-2 TaxID=3144846 RepID=UPI0031F60FCB